MKITHTTKDQFWQDEAGTKIPVNRVNKVEKLHERSSAKLLKEAQAVNKALTAFKKLMEEECAKAYAVFMESKQIAQTAKGNYVWYNFNRTIKIEVKKSEPIKFDELNIAAAKTKLEEFLSNEISSKNSFVKDMVLDAFETQRNSTLDVKKVLGLTRYKAQINDPLFTEAIDLITAAIRRPETKTYFRIWVKDDSGQYQNIDLNLASI